MAREDKPLELRPIDEDVVDTTPVIRLENRETELREKEVRPVRLSPIDERKEISQRLDLPAKEEVELRTHQPGIEVLIEQEAVNPDVLEQNWGEATIRRNPVPWGWFALIGLAIAGAVVWSLNRVEKADKQADQIRIETQTALVDDEKEVQEATRLIDRIEKTLRSFFDAKSVDSLARMVRHPERVTPLMQAYYGKDRGFPGALKSLKMLQPLTLDKRGNFWMATVSLAGDKSESLIIEIMDSGEPRIDWETLVCHQPMKWDDFVAQRPAGESLDFRVYVERDNFYSHEFADSNQWVSFRLTALESEETLFGYAHAGSADAVELTRLIELNGGQRANLILRLGIPEGLKSRRGVVIEKLVNPRWLYMDPPNSEP